MHVDRLLASYCRVFVRLSVRPSVTMYIVAKRSTSYSDRAFGFFRRGRALTRR